MAATKTPLAAFTACKFEVREMPAESEQYDIMDAAAARVWTGAAWRWTIGSFTLGELANDTQDYEYSGSLTDLLHVFDAYVITSGADQPRPLKAVSALPLSTHLKGPIGEIAHTTGKFFRVFPNPGTVGAPSGQFIVVLYKKTRPLITAGNAGSAGALVMDDDWYWVYEEFVRFYTYRYAFDDRAGVAQFDPQSGKWTYTGQLGIAQAALEEMRQREKLPVEWVTGQFERVDKR